MRPTNFRKDFPMTLRLTAEAVTQHIQSRYLSTELEEAIKLQNDNVFFATMKFDGIDLKSSRSSPSTYLNQYGEWYHRLMQDAFGKHLGRKRRLQPLSYAFIDFPGSRLGRNPTVSDEPVGLNDLTQHREITDYLNSGLLHVHAVMSLLPGPGQACRLGMLASTSTQSREFGEIEISQFDPKLGSLQNLVAYSMKGAIQLGSMIKDDCWGLFPR
jgi:hypothetical protein